MDNASSSLAQIRKEITATMSGISRSLQSILRAAQSEGIIDKDTDDKLREVLTEEEYELISQKTSKKVDRVHIKFKIVEILQDIIK